MPLYTMAGPNKPATTVSESNKLTSMSSVAQWVQQQNQNLEQQGANFSSPNQMNLGFSPSGSSGNMMPQNMRPGWPPGQMPPGMRSPNSFGPGMAPGGPGGHPIQGHPGFMARMGGCLPPGHVLANLPHPNLLHNKVPNENLTPEQRQRREEQLANLRKIQQMLFPEQHGGAMPPGMMLPEEMVGMMPPGMMPGQPGMIGSPGMGSPPPPHMMGSPVNMMNMMQQGSPRMGPSPFPAGGIMPNMENMTPAQHEWLRLQQEYYSEKQRKQHMQQMGMTMPGGGPPPPSYFTSMHRRQGMPPGGVNGPLSPTSASLNRQLQSPRSMGPLSPVSDPQVFMFPGQQRPPMPMEFGHPGVPAGHPGMPPDHPGMPPDHPGMPSDMNFDPGMELGMPDGLGGMFLKEGMGPMPPHLTMQGKVGLPAMMHHVGNPEPFNPSMLDLPMVGPGTPTSNSPGPTKPPPSYAQAQKRKRSGGDDVDELYKKLQPAPSPQQFSYLNQFDGQELTITKQLNMAYQETPPNPASPSKQPRQQVVASAVASAVAPVSEHQSTQSPLSLPATDLPSASSCPTMSVASPLPSSTPNSRPSSASGHMIGMTAVMTTATPAGPRLSHFEPMLRRAGMNKQQLAMPMSNITSASLANLAKGVEHLSDQMQQKMMQGGPFHTIQVQGQMAEVGGETSPSPGGAKKMGALQQGVPPPSPIASMPQPPQQPQQPQQQQPQQQPPPQQKAVPQQSTGQPNSPHPNQQPTVNNTYVNATMSIGQLNIQGMNQLPGAVNYGPSMQVQQMNSEQHMGMAPGIPVPSGMMPPQQQHQQAGMMPMQHQPQPGGGGGGGMASMTQQSSMSMMGGYMQQHQQQHGAPHEGMMSNPMQQQHQQGGPANMAGVPPNQMSQPNFPYGCVHPDDAVNMPKSMHGQPPGGRPMQPPSPLSGALNSPGYQPTTPNPVGNASVQIQAKAPNTIQYLPAKPAASQPSQMPGPAMPGAMSGAMHKDFNATSPRFVQGRPQEAHPGGPPLRVVMPGGPGQQQMTSHQMMAMQQSGHMTMQQMQSLQYEGPMPRAPDHMHGGGPAHMQGGPMPGSMPGGPGSMQGVPSAMQGGPMPGGPGSMPGGPGHMQGGPMPGGQGPMHGGGPMQGGMMPVGHGGMPGGPGGPMPGSPGPMMVNMGPMPGDPRDMMGPGSVRDMMGPGSASDMILMQMQGQQMQGHPMMGHPGGGGMRPDQGMMMGPMGQPQGGAYSMQQFQQQQFSRPGETPPAGMMHAMGRPDMGGPAMGGPGGPGGMMIGPGGMPMGGMGPGGMPMGSNPNQFMNMMPNLP